MIGFPDDTEESIRGVLRYAKQVNPTFANFNIVTPYPGTEFFEQVKEQIADFDFTKYTVYTPVMKYKHLTAEQVTVLHAKCFMRYYFRWQWVTSNIHLWYPLLQKLGVNMERRAKAATARPAESPSVSRCDRIDFDGRKARPAPPCRSCTNQPSCAATSRTYRPSPARAKRTTRPRSRSGRRARRRAKKGTFYFFHCDQWRCDMLGLEKVRMSPFLPHDNHVPLAGAVNACGQGQLDVARLTGASDEGQVADNGAAPSAVSRSNKSNKSARI